MEDGLLLLTLALAAHRRLAHGLYPVCQALACIVIAGCSRVTCSSVDDLAALLASPRWYAGGSKTVTGLKLTRQSSGPPLQDSPAAAGCLYVCIKTAAALKQADVALLVSLAPQCPDLQLLDIGSNPWWGLGFLELPYSKKGLSALVGGAAQHWPQLRTLDLSDNSIANPGAHALAANVVQHCEHLQHLKLQLNAIGDQAARVLAAACQSLTQLQVLDLRWNYISYSGPKAIEDLFQAAPDLRAAVIALKESACVAVI